MNAALLGPLLLAAASIVMLFAFGSMAGGLMTRKEALSCKAVTYALLTAAWVVWTGRDAAAGRAGFLVVDLAMVGYNGRVAWQAWRQWRDCDDDDDPPRRRRLRSWVRSRLPRPSARTLPAAR